MHAQGRCNKTSAHIAFVIGNGNVDNNDVIHRSDAFIVDWNGVASGGDFITSAGYKLSDISAILDLLQNKPATGQPYMIGLDSDGNLTWLAV